MKRRKNILIVDNRTELEQIVKESLSKELSNSDISVIMVRAKDGAEAAIKSENQKFDMVLIDTDVPRLMDGGFVYGIQSYKNTQDADIFLISQKDVSELPESLQSSKIFKKPVNPNELIKTMVGVLNAQHHGATDSAPSPAVSTAGKYAVDVRVINAVIKATTNVLVQFGVTDVKMEKACHKAPTDCFSGEISSVVDIKSRSFKGFLTISFDKASYLEVVSTMLMEEQTDLTPDNQDAVGEINNIIFGNAKAEITNFGIELTVPKVLIGKDQHVTCPEGSAAMMIPFSTGKGKFYLTITALPVALAAA